MKRTEVDAKYKWNLDSVMRAEEWEEAFRSLSAEKNSLAKYMGKLKDKSVLLACMKEENALAIRMENLYVYAKMKQDEDTALASSQSMVGRARNLAAEISASASFISPARLYKGLPVKTRIAMRSATILSRIPHAKNDQR